MSRVESLSVTPSPLVPSKIRSQSISDGRLVGERVVDLFQRGSEYACFVLESRKERKSQAQTENQQKADRLSQYLSDLQVTTDDLDPLEVARVSEAWKQLYEWSNRQLKVPKVGFGNEDGCVFVWEDEHTYFELEFVDGLVEFFSKSKVDGQAEDTLLAVDFASMEDFLASEHASHLLRAFNSGRSLLLEVWEPLGQSAIQMVRRDEKVQRFFEEKTQEFAEEDGCEPGFVDRIKGYWDQLYAASDFRLKIPRGGFGQPWAFNMTWENETNYAVLEFVEERIEFYFEHREVTEIDESYKTFDDFLKSSSFQRLMKGFAEEL